MLEIRRGTANRTYENIFFREFSKNLAGMFEKYDVDGLLIGNSECEVESSLQIDVLLIVKNSICIIDFIKCIYFWNSDRNYYNFITLYFRMYYKIW